MIGTLDQAVKKKVVTDFTKDGECSQCGECCSAILPLSQREVHKIKAYVKQKGIKPYKSRMPLAKEIHNLTCPFLDLGKEKEKCMIYEARPAICRCFKCNKLTEFSPELLLEKRIPVNMREVFNDDAKM